MCKQRSPQMQWVVAGVNGYEVHRALKWKPVAAGRPYDSEGHKVNVAAGSRLHLPAQRCRV